MEYPKGNKMPGMDNAQKVADSKTWRVGVEDITSGVFKHPDEGSGPVVGNPYDGDDLGEAREMITWRGGKK
jgi:hypothetical protein